MPRNSYQTDRHTTTTTRNRHRYNPVLYTNHLDFSELISLSLSGTILEEPLLNFTNIIKKNAAKKIITWYKKMKLKNEFINR